MMADVGSVSDEVESKYLPKVNIATLFPFREGIVKWFGKVVFIVSVRGCNAEKKSI